MSFVRQQKVACLGALLIHFTTRNVSRKKKDKFSIYPIWRMRTGKWPG